MVMCSTCYTSMYRRLQRFMARDGQTNLLAKNHESTWGSVKQHKGMV